MVPERCSVFVDEPSSLFLFPFHSSYLSELSAVLVSECTSFLVAMDLEQ
jgi:hypothetical protein